jgi:hypothetical protein
MKVWQYVKDCRLQISVLTQHLNTDVNQLKQSPKETIQDNHVLIEEKEEKDKLQQLHKVD